MDVLSFVPQFKNRPLVFDILRLITSPVKALAYISDVHGEFVSSWFFKKRILIVSKPELLDEIYALEALNKINRDFLHDILAPVFFDGLINSKNDIWLKQRRLMQPLFSRDAVVAWEERIITETIDTVNRLNSSSSIQINMSLTLKTLVQNIFIRVLFGDANSHRDDRKLSAALNTALDTLLPRVAMETLGKGNLKILFSYQNRKYKEATKEITDYVYQEIDRNVGQSENCILSYIMQSEDKKTGYRMTKALLHDEMVGLFIAGQDTTVNILTWFFYTIGKNQVLHDSVCKEITQHREDPINNENLAKLQFTRAVLYETMRHYPPAPGLIRQTLDEVMIGGHNVAKGTSIILNIYGIHHNANYWAEPHEFNPENFLGEAAATRHKYAFMPFGGGAHNCIGRHFSELEMMIIITIILRNYTVKADNIIKGKASVTFKADRDLTATLTPIGELNKYGIKTTCCHQL